jgi:hypothetical protein
MNNEKGDPKFVGGICRVLNEGAANLDRKVVVRLGEIRQEALLRQAQSVVAFSLAGVGHFVMEPLQGHYRGILAVFALAVGAMGVQFWQNLQKASELAEIDSALLSDEVSPGAYLDQGFMEWLNHLSQQEDDSLPQ